MSIQPTDPDLRYATSLLALHKRLAPVRALPDGLIHRQASPYHDILVLKEAAVVKLVFGDSTPRAIESILNLNDPLNLLAPYTQMALLPLALVDQPQRIYILGLGGGRLPTLLHHYFPDVTIECAELDPDVLQVAQTYFGFELDARLQVTIQDGRAYLAGRPADCRYDLIIMDAFREAMFTPYAFATHEFYALCRQHLSAAGVLVVNLSLDDPLYETRLNTLQAAFSDGTLYLFANLAASVVLATHAPRISAAEFLARVEILQSRYHFPFNLVHRAVELLPIEETRLYFAGLGESKEILRDGKPPLQLFDSLSNGHELFRELGLDDPCPCGSGRPFKDCHRSRLKPAAPPED